ncbi:unnamed protein product [Urochloa decumbens]|uniref:Uncharacterized protein n=1 Tax=Urochloa decumbens TaxID=240449 RepID=A0ABC9BR22_9POAL
MAVYCGSSATYSPNSSYQANLDAVSAALPRDASSSPALFATAARGAGSADHIFALTLCRGDEDAPACLDCVAGAFQYAGSSCPYDKEGQLPNGLEIAVKRLASHSGQGFVEFKNEIHLIAKLQHTNLVRLLGCCVQGEEHILIYEYMQNKSLDFFIFDVTRARLLNWDKSLNIIEGIAQGLLYLHKLSRLRVVHRDLKASNILLDNDMNPKISDFGLAKIFSSNSIQGNTNRVVGTYGYMAPEYASEGVFSVKTDVFSFGVLLLEIITGKRNAGFHQQGVFFNLLGYAWKLWKEGRWYELVDESMAEHQHEALEVLKCINIALICAQLIVPPCPTSDVFAMLSIETMSSLPYPKQPAYFNQGATDGELSTAPSSVNIVSISIAEGR